MYFEHRSQPLGDQLGRLDPGVLDVHQADGDVHRLGQLDQQLDLGHLAAGELQGELVHLGPARCAGTAAG